MAQMRRLASLAAIALVISACGGDALPEPADTVATAEVDEPIATTTPLSVQVELPDLGEPQPLAHLDGWLQADFETLDELQGKVVVVQFWTFGCINCKNTLANLRELYDRHKGDEFEVVGIHSPEFNYEKDVDAIAEAAMDLGVTWPIALDTDKFNFFRWQGSPAYWPRTYVLDRDGRIRYDHIGEGAYDELNAAVAALLG